MAQQGLSASREHEMDIFYKGIKIGNRRVDFFVEEKVMVAPSGYASRKSRQ